MDSFPERDYNFNSISGKNLEKLYYPDNPNDEYIDIYKYQRKTPFSQVDTTSIDFAKRYSSKTNTKFETKKVKNYHIDDIYHDLTKGYYNLWLIVDDKNGEKVIADLVNLYMEDGHYENVRGIHRWDKISPSFPTVLKKGRSGRKPMFNGPVLPQNLNELEIPTGNPLIIEFGENLKVEKYYYLDKSRAKDIIFNQ